MDKLKSIYKLIPVPLKTLIATAYGIKIRKWRSYERDHNIDLLKKRDLWSADEWKSWQQIELKKHLLLAAEKVPYYRNYWEQKDDPLNKKKSELKNWPIITKDTLRDNLNSFINEDFKINDLERIQTSGTSGKPMSHYFDRKSTSLWYAMFQYRAKNWHGLNELDWWANIGGQLVIPYSRQKPPFWVTNFAMRQIYFSSYHISSSNAESYLLKLRESEVKYILGYTSSIYWLAYYGIEQKICTPKIKAILVNAEPLYDYQREIIEKYFGCKVVETYSSSERAFGGNECEKGSMHYFPDAGLIEVLNDDNTTCKLEQGRFVITGLVNKAMPLIRYETGDVGSVSWSHKCKCGRGMPLITEITGRLDDTVLTMDGRRVGRLDPVFKTDLRISESQIVQRSLKTIVVNIVPEEGFNEQDKARISQGLKQRLGDSIEVEFEIMKTIPRLKNGKFKSVISEL